MYIKLAGFLVLGVLTVVTLLTTALKKHEEGAAWGWLLGIAFTLGTLVILSQLLFP